MPGEAERPSPEGNGAEREPRWIGGPPDHWLRFRTHVDGGPGELELTMTASAQYTLWVNGDLIGHGPPRGYHHRYFTDRWVVRVNGDAQEIVVLVFSPEEPGMTFVASPAALLWAKICLAEARGSRVTVVTDETWDVEPVAGYASDAPRFSIQQAVEEHFDATLTDGPPERAHPVEISWELVPYPLTQPRLQRQSASLAWMPRVRPLKTKTFSHSLSPFLGRVGQEPSKPSRRGAAGIAVLTATGACRVRLDWLAFQTDRKAFLNGEEVSWRSSPCTLALVPGPNRLVFDLTHKGPFDVLEWAYRLTFDPAEAATVEVSNRVVRDLRVRDLNAALRRLSRGEAVVASAGASWALGSGAGRRDIMLVELGTEIGAELTGPPERVRWPVLLEPGKRILFDLGELMSGYVGIRSDAGDRVTLHVRLFEAVSGGEPVNMAPYRNCLEICLGGQETEYVSPFRRGARYVEVTHAGGESPLVLLNVFLCREQRLDPPVGFCEATDPMVARLFQASCRTLSLSVADAFVDCPSFEQVSWVGDMLAMTAVNHRVWGEYPRTAHSLALAKDSLDAHPTDWANPPSIGARRMVSHAASAIYNEIPAWSFLWVTAVRELFWDGGDLEMLRDLYGGVARVLEQATKDLDRDGRYVRRDVWNFFDWTLDLPREGAIAIHHALFVRALSGAEEMANALGRTNAAAHWASVRAQLLRAIEQTFWDAAAQGYRDVAGYAEKPLTLQTQTLMLWAGAVPPARRPMLVARMPGPEALGVARESPWYLFFHLWCLIDAGDRRGAWKLLADVWGSELCHGKETFWEIFPSDHNPQRARSLAHGWSATPAYGLSRVILGVDPLSPGYRTCRVSPYLPEDGHVTGAVPTPRGPLDVRATREAGRLSVTVCVPEGVTVDCEDPLHPGARASLREMRNGEQRSTPRTWQAGTFQATFETGGDGP